MKCLYCGKENREGIKYCEQCMQELVPSKSPAPASEVELVCAACGFKNRAGVSFCEQCTEPLSKTFNLAADTTPRPGETEPTSPPPSSPPPPPAAEEPPLIVQTPPKKRNRLNPLWLLLLLLLLLTCCCMLLLFGYVETPTFVQPYLEPYLDRMRNNLPNLPFLPGLPRVDCENLEEMTEFLNEDDGSLGCWGIGNTPQECFVNVENFFNTRDDISEKEMQDLMDSLVLINQENGREMPTMCLTETICQNPKVDCEFELCYFDIGDAPGFTRVKEPSSEYDKGTYLVVQAPITFSFDHMQCEKKEQPGEIEWEGDEGEEEALPPQKCCQEVEVVKEGYETIPGVTDYLTLDLACNKGDFGLEGEDCYYGKVYVGDPAIEFWTDMECCVSGDGLECRSTESLSGNRKYSKSLLVLDGRECGEMEATFKKIGSWTPPEKPKKDDRKAGCENGGSPCGDNPCCLSCCYGCNAGEDSCDD